VPTILIVEDDTSLLVLVEAALKQAGYQTVTAGSVAQAQTIIDSAQALDLAFVDISLISQQEGGLQIGRMARQIRPNLPVLYTSGQPPADTMQAAFVQQSAFLQKPYTAQQVIGAVSALLGKR